MSKNEKKIQKCPKMKKKPKSLKIPRTLTITRNPKTFLWTFKIEIMWLFFQMLWRIFAKLEYIKGKSIGKVERNKITTPHTSKTDI